MGLVFGARYKRHPVGVFPAPGPAGGGVDPAMAKTPGAMEGGAPTRPQLRFVTTTAPPTPAWTITRTRLRLEVQRMRRSPLRSRQARNVVTRTRTPTIAATVRW